jgi:pyruvate carboxylase subunit B
VKYVVELNGERREVELEGAEGSVGDRQFTAHLEEIDGTPVRIVTVGSQVHRVVMRRGATRGSYTLWVDGWRFDGDALDERTRAIREITAAASKSTGPAPVVAPMPGMIVRVSIAVGDQVHAGQGLVVMEAMKMENELRASAGGRVKSIFASPGTAVEKGTLLVELEAVTP